jgi:fructose-1-phosphate kinase PfkB-like protein
MEEVKRNLDNKHHKIVIEGFTQEEIQVARDKKKEQYLNMKGADCDVDDVACLSVSAKKALFKSKMVIDHGFINEAKVRYLFK